MAEGNSSPSVVLFSIAGPKEIRASVVPGDAVSSPEQVRSLFGEIAAFALDQVRGLGDGRVITCTFDALALVASDLALRNGEPSPKQADRLLIDGGQLHFSEGDAVNPKFAEGLLAVVQAHQDRIPVPTSDEVLVLAISASERNLIDGVEESVVVPMLRAELAKKAEQGALLLEACDRLIDGKFVPLVVSINDGTGAERTLIVGLRPSKKELRLFKVREPECSVPPKE